MPVHAYRCDCGRTADVLVKGSIEPQTCDDAPRDFAGCARAGVLTRQVSAPYIGRAGVGGRSEPAPQGCDHCNDPGNCGEA